MITETAIKIIDVALDYSWSSYTNQAMLDEEREAWKIICDKLSNNRRFQKPTIDDIKAYCIERKNTVDPQKFIDHYISNGWVVGNAAMKDWRAAVRTWEKRSFSYDVKPQNTIRPQPSRCDMFKLPEAESPEAVTAAANNAREMFRALTNKTKMIV